MDRRTTAIVVTIAAMLLCGCPGLVSLLSGAMFALISFVPDAEIDIFGSSDPQAALNFGLGQLCLGILFVLFAAALIFYIWRRASAPAASGTMPPPPA